ncbi:hypothetical protein [Streptomyces sp. AK04-3B]|uniref:hypothetical protein n=1 Tax=Streptomyces sp. AK04-3B TaxID=3028650 RepID=UPI0029B7E76B|nr:hypothetical protein [Streptomyces sp. AK04-3B]MDX3803749.1 hypothetical protein [Streptomyces sp. AK04-3B]
MDGEPGAPGPGTGSGVQIAPVLLKTLVTVVVGTVAYVITNLIDQSQDELWKLAMSVVIGGSALIVQYMVDFEKRLGSVEAGQRAQTRELHDHYTRLSDAAGLLHELDQVGMSTDDAKRLIRGATQVGLHGTDLVRDFARAEIRSLSSVVTDLTGRTVHWQRDNNEWLISLTKIARHTIDATSSSVDRPFWDTDPAGPYLDAQIEAMRRRQVVIRRLFMIKAAEEQDEQFMLRFMELCQEQRELDINVRFMVLPEQRRRTGPATRDVVIFDSALCLEYTTDHQGSNVRTRLDAITDSVRDEASRFDTLWEAATEPIPRPGLTPDPPLPLKPFSNPRRPTKTSKPLFA